MKFLVTIDDGAGRRTFPAVGDIAALVDAAYDGGALGVTYRVLP